MSSYLDEYKSSVFKSCTRAQSKLKIHRALSSKAREGLEKDREILEEERNRFEKQNRELTGDYERVRHYFSGVHYKIIDS